MTSPAPKPDTNFKPLRIGVLITSTIQLLDLAAIDLFSMLSPSYLKACNMPPSIIALGIPSEIYYIGSSNPKLGSSILTGKLTASLTINLTSTTNTPAVLPGKGKDKLDILFIPGPPPHTLPPDDILSFVRAHHDAGTTVLTICTGCEVAAHAGILDGKRVCGPRGLLGELKTKFPRVGEWEGKKRWVRDGEIWSSGMSYVFLPPFLRKMVLTCFVGGITNGIDLIVGYLRENYPATLVDVVCAMADVGDRALEYGTDPIAEKKMCSSKRVRTGSE